MALCSACSAPAKTTQVCSAQGPSIEFSLVVKWQNNTLAFQWGTWWFIFFLKLLNLHISHCSFSLKLKLWRDRNLYCSWFVYSYSWLLYCWCVYSYDLFLLSSWYNEWFIHTVLLIFLMFQGVWKMILNFETVLWALQLIPEQTVWILCIPKSCSTCAWLGRRSLKALGQQRKTCSTQRIKGFDVIPLELPAASIGFKSGSVLTAQTAEQSAAATCLCGGGVLCLSNTQI